MRRINGRRVASAVAVIVTLAVGLPTVTGDPTTAGAVDPTSTIDQSTIDENAAVTAAATSSVADRAGLAPGNSILWTSDDKQEAELAVVEASGATWTTLDVDWNHIQSDGPSSWRWNVATDRAVLAMRGHGLRIVGVAGYSPVWARRSDCPSGELHCFPQNAADYGRFMGAAAARYGSQATNTRLRNSVTVWSLWNEPNHRQFSMPKPDPVKYAAMVKSAYVAIKAADPTAIVLTGGTAPAPDATDGTEYQPTTWLEGLYARGAGGYFDGVAHHPYSYPTNPLDAHTWNAYTQTQYLYDIMVAHGDGAKKVWGTEMGAPTGTSSQALSEAKQAQWVRDYYRGWNTTFRAFTGPLIWYRARDVSTNVAKRDDNLGLLRYDRTPKPAYPVFQEVMGTSIVTPTVDYTGRTVPRLGRKVAVNPKGGHYALAKDGRVTAFDGAPYYGSPQLPNNLARGMVVMPDGRGYLVLDGFGGVHKFGTAGAGTMASRKTGYFGFDIARDIVLTSDGRGYAVLDGYGGVHIGGTASVFNLPYWRGWDVARAFAYSPNGGGAYVLDAFGGVHVAGNAVGRKAGYWKGWDIARDIVITPDNGGYAVLDGFGGVHRAGNAPKPGANWAYWQWDHAGALGMVGGGYVVAS